MTANIVTAKIRLFVNHPLGATQSIALDRDQANYLFAVMRLSVGDQILVFNGRDGEWLAQISWGSKRAGTLNVVSQTKPLQSPPDLWLMFAPIKKARTDFIVEKATELGAAEIFPISTDYTNSERIRQDRLQAHAVEATEQCGGTYVPVVHDMQSLEKCLQTWPNDRNILFCDEAMVGQAPADLSSCPAGNGRFSSGPKAGFPQPNDKNCKRIPNRILSAWVHAFCAPIPPPS